MILAAYQTPVLSVDTTNRHHLRLSISQFYRIFFHFIKTFNIRQSFCKLNHDLKHTEGVRAHFFI